MTVSEKTWDLWRWGGVRSGAEKVKPTQERLPSCFTLTCVQIWEAVSFVFQEDCLNSGMAETTCSLIEETSRSCWQVKREAEGQGNFNPSQTCQEGLEKDHLHCEPISFSFLIWQVFVTMYTPLSILDAIMNEGRQHSCPEDLTVWQERETLIKYKIPTTQVPCQVRRWMRSSLDNPDAQSRLKTGASSAFVGMAVTWAQQLGMWYHCT